MNKDVIYIDNEDDITAIINKLKKAQAKIIALVPPKRTGVLQSAVNVRLLDKVARQNSKRLVLITNDQALMALAAAAKIPVAKSLQSKPEIPEVTALKIDDNDMIDGAQLPVGDHQKIATNSKDDSEISQLINGVNLDDSGHQDAYKNTKEANSKNKDKTKRIPNFNSFRKKLFIGGGLAVLLIGFLVWALFFAPKATIVITAKTSPVSVKDAVQFGSTTNVEKGTLKSEAKSLKKDASVEFTPTGKKDVGEKARGVISLRTEYIGDLGRTVPAGTAVKSSSGLIYYTNGAITFSSSNWTGAEVEVVAAEPGEKYNAASGAVGGLPSRISGNFSSAPSGGTTKIIPIVTADDVQKAGEKLVDQSTDEIKTELSNQFSSSDIVILSSFSIERADPVSSPAVGGEAPDEKAKLTSNVTYKMIAVTKSEVENYLQDTLKKRMEDQTAQKVYSSGVDNARFSDFKQPGSANLLAIGQIGPVIDEQKIKQEVAGQKFGDIREKLTKIEGVNNVEVNFSYFWVRTVPKDLNKIQIEFKVEESSE